MMYDSLDTVFIAKYYGTEVRFGNTQCKHAFSIAVKELP